MMTAVRGSILAMVVGWVLFAGIYFWQNKSSAAKKIFLGLIALIVIFIFVAFMLRSSGVITTGYFERITNFSPTNFTVQTRFWTWQAGIDGWNDHLKTIFVGWGPENFNLPFSIHFNPKFYTGPGSETLFDRAHNMFVEVLVTMGVVGFLSYASIFAAIFFTLRKIISQNSEYKYLAMGLVPLTLVYIIHNCFIFDTSANYITFFSILGLVYFISGKNEPVTQISKNRNGLATIVAAVLIILMTVLIYKTDIIPTKANYANTRGIVAGWTGDANPANFAKYFEEAVKKYKESVEYNSFGTYEYRHKIAQYVLDKSNKASAIKNYNEIMLYVVTELEKTATEFPIDYLPRLYLSRLYVTLDKNNNDNDSKYNDLALKYSTEALNLAPNFVRTYYEIGQVYLNKKDYNMASKYFAKAVELNPKVGLSLWYAGIVEFERKNYDVAYDFVGRAIDLGFAMNEQDYNRALNIFIIQGNKARIAQVAEMMVKSYPNSPSQRAVAAVAFARAGMLDKAEEQARAAAKLDKAFEVEAKVFVESLGRQW
jgi:tetratricopeptide (TPR) repeat protein